MLRRLLPDPFIAWLLVALAIGVILPVAGAAAAVVDSVTLLAIFALFFLHGARLPREALLQGFTDWRLHGVILAITFAAFPLIGLGLRWVGAPLLPDALWSGVIFLCLLPSTVQSSIAFTSMARGNVAGAVAAAAFSNLAGVILTPMLAALLLGAHGAVSPSGIGKIFALLFFPFALGHALRPFVLPHIADRARLTIIIDKGTILLAVYGAFSAATVGGVWTRLGVRDLALLLLVCTLLLTAILGVAVLAGRRFPRESRATILFCGSVKSLASGAPMARILFPGAAAAPILLPIMVFHTLQLIVCAWIAAWAGRRVSSAGDVP